MKKLIIIFLFIITGCVKYTDLDELGIIKSISISYSDEYILRAEIYEEITKDNEPKTRIIKTHGKTINEAFENINLISYKEIFLSHIDLLILDSNLNDDNYQEIFYYFINNKDLRNDFYCIISNNPSSLLHNSQYEEIEKFIKSNNETKRIINVSFDEIINSFLNKKSFILSMINYNNQITYLGNYKYFNNKLERITNEKD